MSATDETAWTIFIVVGIVFDNLTVSNSFDFMYSNLTQNGINSVLGELKLIAGNFATNFFNQY